MLLQEGRQCVNVRCKTKSIGQGPEERQAGRRFLEAGFETLNLTLCTPRVPCDKDKHSRRCSVQRSRCCMMRVSGTWTYCNSRVQCGVPVPCSRWNCTRFSLLQARPSLQSFAPGTESLGSSTCIRYLQFTHCAAALPSPFSNLHPTTISAQPNGASA